MIDAQSALIYTMVLVSAADRDMTDAELETIGDIITHLPVFRKFDQAQLPATAEACAQGLGQPDGLDKTLDLIVDSLPKRLHETAYALACDVAAADGEASQEELRLLEMLRHRLDVGRLEAAAIERGARARHTVL
ncbi:MAG: tellurite resistance TerB family protein [Gammaproteobacteria bacterium]|nr:tellurite resistance TerB family protein [Gammaproteobacteria bacterium]